MAYHFKRMLALAALSFVIWLYLLAGRGGFWRFRAAAAAHGPAPARRVAVIIPARNEAALIGRAIGSLWSQDYPGPYRIFVVDDHSTDGTAEAASGARVLRAPPLEPGWTGKLWALAHGVREAASFEPDYFFFTDADIEHAPDAISHLVSQAESDNRDLVSLMVRLRCESFAERAFVPAFVFFFFKLYPPAWIADPRRRTAGAAGGSILLRASALERIGGLKTIRGALIDDCALAGAVKRAGGRIWLGLARETRSLREYPTAADVGRMVARTAFTQLNHSALLLAGTLAGMFVIYVAPVFTLPFGAAAWAAMCLAYLPALRYYRRSPLWAPFLPLIAAFYTACTIYSALRHWTGLTPGWKGR
jgi:hopene-associated glycosyltransferase HpnB